MPSNCCSVPLCNKRGGHLFPLDRQRRKKWLLAIRRDNWQPNQNSTVCSAHFRPEDYTQHVKRRKLLPAAVPSVFKWSKRITPCAQLRRDRRKRRTEQTSICKFPADMCVEHEVEVTTANRPTDTCTSTCEESDSIPDITFERSTQTGHCRNFSVTKFIFNDKAIMYYTGLESYGKFCLVLASLGPAAYHLKYRCFDCRQLSIEDQFFLALIKLRRYRANFELSLMFDISVCAVTNIYLTWWNFMAVQWRELDIWPSRDLVTFFMADDFKKKFPKTRVILDGLECPIKRPKHPVSQQKTFSTYKNRTTVKCILGITPGGLVSHIPDSYGGSGSDRQLIERDSLMVKCDPKDSIMADKGFNVQDIFAPYDIEVNIPEFFSKKNRMSNKTVMNDRKIASKRVHVERLIGLGKTFAILREPLNDSETKLASDIIFICYMLCNFKPGIVSKTS